MRLNDSIFKEVNKNLEELHKQLVAMNYEMDAKARQRRQDGDMQKSMSVVRSKSL